MSHTTPHRRRQVELFALLASLDINGEMSREDFSVAIQLIITDAHEYRVGLCLTLERFGFLEVHPYNERVRLNPAKFGHTVNLLDTVRAALHSVAKHNPGVLHG